MVHSVLFLNLQLRVRTNFKLMNCLESQQFYSNPKFGEGTLSELNEFELVIHFTPVLNEGSTKCGRGTKPSTCNIDNYDIIQNNIQVRLFNITTLSHAAGMSSMTNTYLALAWKGLSGHSAHSSVQRSPLLIGSGMLAISQRLTVQSVIAHCDSITSTRPPTATEIARMMSLVSWSSVDQSSQSSDSQSASESAEMGGACGC